MDRWVGRVALVTGASVGIGADVCKALVKEGLQVVGCARDVGKINTLSEDLASQNLPGAGRLHGIRCDLSKEDEILNMFKEIKIKYSRLDICINNAGLGKTASLLNGSTEDWRTMIDVNVMAVSICTREAFKLMQECGADDGQFININSMSGHRLGPVNIMPFYCGTKFMLTALTESLRRELYAINSGIRVVQISPGFVVSEFATRAVGQEVANRIHGQAKCLQPEDISSIVLYILKCPAHVNINDVLIRPVSQQW